MLPSRRRCRMLPAGPGQVGCRENPRAGARRGSPCAPARRVTLSAAVSLARSSNQSSQSRVVGCVRRERLRLGSCRRSSAIRASAADKSVAAAERPDILPHESLQLGQQRDRRQPRRGIAQAELAHTFHRRPAAARSTPMRAVRLSLRGGDAIRRARRTPSASGDGVARQPIGAVGAAHRFAGGVQPGDRGLHVGSSDANAAHVVMRDRATSTGILVRSMPFVSSRSITGPNARAAPPRRHAGRSGTRRRAASRGRPRLP